MNPRTDDGPLHRLDTLLGDVGEWLLVGYTVAMILVAFVPGAPRHDDSTAPVDAPVQMMVG
jgi:hypothetical protein